MMDMTSWDHALHGVNKGICLTSLPETKLSLPPEANKRVLAKELPSQPLGQEQPLP